MVPQPLPEKDDSIYRSTGFGFGDKRANRIGAWVLLMVIVGFIAGVLAMILILVAGW